MKRKSEDISPSETQEDQENNENSLLSTFFSPVLQYFGGAAGQDNGQAGALMSHADSKWETKSEKGDDRELDSRVSMPSLGSVNRLATDNAMSISSEEEEEAVPSVPSSSAINNVNTTTIAAATVAAAAANAAADAAAANANAAAVAAATAPSNTRNTAVMPILPNNGSSGSSGNSIVDEELDADEVEDVLLQEEFNPYAFIKGLPAYSDVVPPHKPRPVLLPPQSSHRPTLVLDLDETLVHCSIDPIPNPDLTFKVDFNGTLYDVFVRKRPHFEEFLEHVSRTFEVVVFTASQQVYAERLLNILDPKKRWIHHRLYRDACLCVDGNYLKDLTVLGRDLSKTVLVDNSPHAFGYQIDNGIPIESWFDDDNDTELRKLSPFLDRLHTVKDVRTILRQQFQLRCVVEAQIV
jgi:CTD small phosphatase-like protein 2